MTLHYSGENGRGGPPHWPPHPPTQPSGNKLSDLTKAGVPITIVGGMIYAVYMAIQMAFSAGENVGAHKQTLATLQHEMREVRSDLKAIKEVLPEMKAVLTRLDQRWAVEVRK